MGKTNPFATKTKPAPAPTPPPEDFAPQAVEPAAAAPQAKQPETVWVPPQVKRTRPVAEGNIGLDITSAPDFDAFEMGAQAGQDEAASALKAKRNARTARAIQEQDRLTGPVTSAGPIPTPKDREDLPVEALLDDFRGEYPWSGAVQRSTDDMAFEGQLDEPGPASELPPELGIGGSRLPFRRGIFGYSITPTEVGTKLAERIIEHEHTQLGASQLLDQMTQDLSSGEDVLLKYQDKLKAKRPGLNPSLVNAELVLSRNPDLNEEDTAAVQSAIGVEAARRQERLDNRAVKWAAAAKTVGKWTVPIYLRTDKSVPTLAPGTNPLAPRVAVLGIDEKGRAVYRMQTPGAYAVDLLDVPQYAATGAIESVREDKPFGETVAHSVGERQTFLELTSRVARQKAAAGELGQLEAIALGSVGASATVLFPTVDMGLGLARKGGSSAVRAVRVRKMTTMLDDLSAALRNGDAGGYTKARDALSDYLKLNQEFNRTANAFISAQDETLATLLPRIGDTPAEVYRSGKIGRLRAQPLDTINDEFFLAEMAARRALQPTFGAINGIASKLDVPGDIRSFIAKYFRRPAVLEALADGNLELIRREVGYLLPDGDIQRFIQAVSPHADDVRAALPGIKSTEFLTDAVADAASALSKRLKSPPGRRTAETIGTAGEEALRVEAAKGQYRVAAAAQTRKMADKEHRTLTHQIRIFEQRVAEVNKARQAMKTERARELAELGARQQQEVKAAFAAGDRKALMQTKRAHSAELGELKVTLSTRSKTLDTEWKRLNQLLTGGPERGAEPGLRAQAQASRIYIDRLSGAVATNEAARAAAIRGIEATDTAALPFVARILGLDVEDLRKLIRDGGGIPTDVKKQRVIDIATGEESTRKTGAQLPVLKGNKMVWKRFDEVNTDVLRQVQAALDARPKTGTRGISTRHENLDYVPEKMSEGLYGINLDVESWRDIPRVIAGTTLRMVFGGDDIADLRTLPQHMHQDIKAAGRIGDNILADVAQLVAENNHEALLAYFNGKLVKFRNGQNVLTSGRSPMPDIAALMRADLQDMRGVSEAIKKMSLNDLKSVVSDDVADAFKAATAGKLSKEMVEDVRKLLGESEDGKAIAMLALARERESSIFYELSYALWEGTQFGDATTMFSVYKALLEDGVEDGKRFENFLAAIAASQTIRNPKAARRRGTILLGTFAGHNRARDHLAKTGISITQREKDLLNRMVVADPLEPGEVELARKLLERFGVPNASELLALQQHSQFLPKVVRQRLQNSLTKGLYRKDKAGKLKGGQGLNPEGFLLRIYKTAMTQGLGFARPRYYTQNWWGDLEQVYTVLGMKTGADMSLRNAPQLLGSAPGVQNVLRAVGLQEPVARVLQRLGELPAKVMAKFTAEAGNIVEVNKLMDGIDETVELGGHVHTYKAHREIMARTGVFDTFDTSVVQKALLDDVSRYAPVEYAKDVVFRAVSDYAQAVSARQRAGLYAILVENGHHPEVAAKMVTDALFDYSTTITPADRNIFIRCLLPFWGWQKNANRFIVDAMFNPYTAWRLNVARKFPNAAGYLATEGFYGGYYDATGINPAALSPAQRTTYDAMMARLAEEYGKDIPEDALRAVGAAVAGVQSAETAVFDDKNMPYQAPPGQYYLNPEEEGTSGQVYMPRPSMEQRKSYLQLRPAVSVTPKPDPALRRHYENFDNTDYAYTNFYWPEPIQYALWRHGASIMSVMLNAVALPVTGEEGSMALARSAAEFDVKRAPLMGEMVQAYQGKPVYGAYIHPWIVERLTNTHPYFATAFTSRVGKDGTKRYSLVPGIPSVGFKYSGLGRLNELFPTTLETATDKPDEFDRTELYQFLRFWPGVLQRDVSPEESAEIEGRHH